MKSHCFRCGASRQSGPWIRLESREDAEDQEQTRRTWQITWLICDVPLSSAPSLPRILVLEVESMDRMPIVGPGTALLVGSLLLAGASVSAHPAGSPAGGRALSVLSSSTRAVSPAAPSSRERGVKSPPEDPPSEAEVWRDSRSRSSARPWARAGSTRWPALTSVFTGSTSAPSDSMSGARPTNDCHSTGASGTAPRLSTWKGSSSVDEPGRGSAPPGGLVTIHPWTARPHLACVRARLARPGAWGA